MDIESELRSKADTGRVDAPTSMLLVDAANELARMKVELNSRIFSPSETTFWLGFICGVGFGLWFLIIAS